MRRTLPAVIALLLVAAGCGSGSSADRSDAQATAVSSSTPPPAATSTPAPTGTTEAAPNVVDYGEDEVTVSRPSDASRLPGAPADFTAFIRAELVRQQAVKDDACSGKVELRVARLDPRGWAAGGTFIPQCGGTPTLWARVDGAWREVWSDQTLPDCATLKKFRFPVAIAQGTCIAGGKEIPYAG